MWIVLRWRDSSDLASCYSFDLVCTKVHSRSCKILKSHDKYMEKQFLTYTIPTSLPLKFDSGSFEATRFRDHDWDLTYVGFALGIILSLDFHLEVRSSYLELRIILVQLLSGDHFFIKELTLPILTISSKKTFIQAIFSDRVFSNRWFHHFSQAEIESFGIFRIGKVSSFMKMVCR